MGVPAFFRWLREKYPRCIDNCVEEETTEVDGVEVPVDLTKPSPNNREFDNLYLVRDTLHTSLYPSVQMRSGVKDMNGIIHPCVHPEDIPAPETEEDMFRAIFAYIDRLMAAVRPRKVLFMAVDGVAPRAKMNQQRSRRFKAAQEMQEEEEVENELREAMAKKGHKAPPKKKATFDHNVITPGTKFMDRLSVFLRYYVHDRLNNHAGWRGLDVILSDASVPGEGEHKIMEFIRQQRACPGYSPNVRHILHGLDADLIMLGLATHEPHFTVLREDVLGGASNKCFVCGQEGHRADQCNGLPPPKRALDGNAGAPLPPNAEAANSATNQGTIISRKPLQFLSISVLREYLEMEFASVTPGLPFPFDLERIIDDFVFLCFFVGNDFLPHLPSLDIREGAIDLLMTLYKKHLAAMGGYMTYNGEVRLDRVDVLLAHVGAVEDEIFRRRKSKEDRDKRVEGERAAAKERSRGAQDAQAAAVRQIFDQHGNSIAPASDSAEAKAEATTAAALAALNAGVESIRVRALAQPLPEHKPAEAAAAAGQKRTRDDQYAAGMALLTPAERAIVDGVSFPGSVIPRASSGPGSGPSSAAAAPAVSSAAATAQNRSAAAAMRAALLGGGGGGPAEAAPAPALAPATAAANQPVPIVVEPPDDVKTETPATETASPVPPVAPAVAASESEGSTAKRLRAEDGSARVPELDGQLQRIPSAPDGATSAPDIAGASAAPTVGGVWMSPGAAVGSDGLPIRDPMAAAAAADGTTVTGSVGEPSVSGDGGNGTSVTEAASMDDDAAAAALLAAGADDIFDEPLRDEELEEGLEEAAANIGAAPLPPTVAASSLDEMQEAVEEDVAASMTAMMKSAVLRALLAKRTRENVPDVVAFGTQGAKERYYRAKFGDANGSSPAYLKNLFKSYAEGLCWVFRYYYQGVASWTWFFPFHYAPMASDLRNLDAYEIKFELGRPFRPLDQLMGVLPPRSSHALPPACAALMTNHSSPIRDFYPERFGMDPNGKKFTWQWVVLLPFIDEARLVKAVDSVLATFTPEERRRNSWGNELLFVHNKAPVAPYVRPLVPRIDDEEEEEDDAEENGAGGAAAATPAPAPASASAASSSADGTAGGAAPASAKPASSGSGAVTPCVAEAMALIERAAVASATLRPEMGDPVTLKGLSAYVISIKDGGGSVRGVAAVPLGGTVPSPHPVVLLEIPGNQALGVTFLPPKRRPHVCRLLQGTDPARRVLTPDDDASQRVPRLTRGMNIADLALSREQRDQQRDQRGGGYGGGGGGGGGYGYQGDRGGDRRHWNGPAAAGQQPVYQSQYGGDQGYRQGPPPYAYPQQGPPPPQYPPQYQQQGLSASQRMILGTLGIPMPQAPQPQQQQYPPRPAYPPPYASAPPPGPYGAQRPPYAYPPPQPAAAAPYYGSQPQPQTYGRPGPPPLAQQQLPLPYGPLVPAWPQQPGYAPAQPPYGAPYGMPLPPPPRQPQPYTPFQPPPYGQPPPYAPQPPLTQPQWLPQPGPYSYQPRR